MYYKELMSVIHNVYVKIIHFIKARPRSHHVFEKLSSEMEAQHKHFCLH